MTRPAGGALLSYHPYATLPFAQEVHSEPMGPLTILTLLTLLTTSYCTLKGALGANGGICIYHMYTYYIHVYIYTGALRADGGSDAAMAAHGGGAGELTPTLTLTPSPNPQP
eukprot:scaffold101281_cov27-Phaeocystis_antarctica.AAC.1